MPFVFPKIYPILDASVIPAANRTAFLDKLGRSLAEAGVTLLEYRNKTGSDTELLADATVLRAALGKGQVRLVLDDRAELVAQLGFDGVHVDAGDRTPAEARALLGPEAIIGTFGGSESMVPGVLAVPANYFSIGPIAPTTTKQTEKPPIGVEGVRHLRAEAGPAPILSAAGGVTLELAPHLLEAGANIVAVSSAIFRAPDPAAEFRRWQQYLK
jgi:thiamine-phosphate pyrophosphorylase